MTIIALNSKVVRLFRSKGNQRLWLIFATVWVVLAGWHFWKALPQYQLIDVSQQVADLCQSEESGNIYAAGENAFQRCLRKRGPVPTSTDLESVTAKLTIETACNAERASASVAEQTRDDPHQTDCMIAKTGSAQNAVQPEADRAVDEARTEQLLGWVALTFLPPLALPIGAALLLYGLWIIGRAAKWIGDGYRHKP